MKNADMFAMLSQSTEFDQIQVRDNEIEELTAILKSDHCPMEVKVGCRVLIHSQPQQLTCRVESPTSTERSTSCSKRTSPASS
jgi:hypothetical protein